MCEGYLVREYTVCSIHRVQSCLSVEYGLHMESMDLFTGCYALYTPVVCLSVTRVWSLYGVYVGGVSSANGKGRLAQILGNTPRLSPIPAPFSWYLHKYLHKYFLDIFIKNIFTNIFLISAQIYFWYVHKYLLDIFTNIGKTPRLSPLPSPPHFPDFFTSLLSCSTSGLDQIWKLVDPQLC